MTLDTLYLVSTDHPSPNRWTAAELSARGITRTPRYAVLHKTEGDFEGALSWLTSPRSGVSSHWLVDKDGSIEELVDPADCAWHAGTEPADKLWGPYRSMWGWGNENIYSVGIEWAGLVDDEITAAQHDAAAWLLAYYMPVTRGYSEFGAGLSRDFVQGHRDLSRLKSDPQRFDAEAFWARYDYYKAAQKDPYHARFFPETGHSVGGGFLELWETHGLSVCGYPLTEEYAEHVAAYGRRVTYQLFENVRMMYYPGIQARIDGLGMAYLKERQAHDEVHDEVHNESTQEN